MKHGDYMYLLMGPAKLIFIKMGDDVPIKTLLRSS